MDGAGPDENIRANFQQIGASDHCLDAFVGDFAHLPWREGAFLDAIVSDRTYFNTQCLFNAMEPFHGYQQ